MNILAAKCAERVGARAVRFAGDMLIVELTDGREVSLPLKRIDWLDWLAKATPKQKANWSLEPLGYAVYWEDFDDGFEVERVLSLQPLAPLLSAMNGNHARKKKRAESLTTKKPSRQLKLAKPKHSR
jgi:hypothetical protein